MRYHGLVVIALGLMVGNARADDGVAARALLDEAIRAHGGEAALTKWAVATAKTKGIFHGYERTPVFFFTSEITRHGPNQTRYVLDGKLNDQKFRVANTYDGQRGWILQQGSGVSDTRECTAEELQGRKEDAYVSWIATLAPLKSSEFNLAIVGEEKVENGPAIGIRVTRQGYRDVTLFIDKSTRLLVKIETRAKAGTPVEGKVETFLRLYKDFQGTQRPTMMTVHHNGRSLMSHWVQDYVLAEAPAAGLFGKP